MELTTSDNAIRQQWFQAFLIFVISETIFSFYCLFSLVASNADNVEVAFTTIREIVPQLLLNPIFYAITYHFAYTKFGNLWLGILIILVPFSFVFAIAHLFYGPTPLNALVLSYYHSGWVYFFRCLNILVFSFYLSSMVYFWRHSIKRYKLNRSLRNSKMSESA